MVEQVGVNSVQVVQLGRHVLVPALGVTRPLERTLCLSSGYREALVDSCLNGQVLMRLVLGFSCVPVVVVEVSHVLVVPSLASPLVDWLAEQSHRLAHHAVLGVVRGRS